MIRDMDWKQGWVASAKWRLKEFSGAELMRMMCLFEGRFIHLKRDDKIKDRNRKRGFSMKYSKSIELIIANNRLEGIETSQDTIANLIEIEAGRKTVEECIQEALEKYKR